MASKGFNLSMDMLGSGLEQGISNFEKAIVEEKKVSVQTVPLSKIIPNPKNQYSIDDIETLAFHIKQQGQLQPALVVPDGDKYRLVSGERRYTALQYNRAKTIDVIVLEDLGETDEEIILIATNSYRTKTDAEKAREIARLTQLYREKQQELPDFMAGKTVSRAVADTVNISPSQVNRSIRFASLAPELQALADENVIGVSTAQMFADFPPPLQQEIVRTIRNIAGEKGGFSREDGAGVKAYYTDLLTRKERELNRSQKKISALERALNDQERLQEEKESLRKQLAEQQAELERLQRDGGSPIEAAVEERLQYRQAVSALEDSAARLAQALEQLAALRNREGFAADPESERLCGQQLERLRSLLATG